MALVPRLVNRAITCGRKTFTTSAVRRAEGGHSDWPEGPGSNLPFQIANRYRLTLVVTLFCASGFGAPFIITRINQDRAERLAKGG